jgi:hypothetical protein
MGEQFLPQDIVKLCPFWHTVLTTEVAAVNEANTKIIYLVHIKVLVFQPAGSRLTAFIIKN